MVEEIYAADEGIRKAHNRDLIDPVLHECSGCTLKIALEDGWECLDCYKFLCVNCYKLHACNGIKK